MRVAAGRYLAEHIPNARYVELQGDDHWWWLGDVNAVVKEVEAFISGLKPISPIDRSLATILCVGLEEREASSVKLHDQVKRIIDDQVQRYHGHRVKNASLLIQI